MSNNPLLTSIEAYNPYNAQECEDKEIILNHLKNTANIFSRSNKMAHMTASAWIVNKERTKVLMAYHNIYNAWSWLGGHADNEQNLLKVAHKEIQEESGLVDFVAVSKDIYSLEVLTVDGHEKKDHYVPSHLHLNITYLFEADDQLPLTVNQNENSGLEWFLLEDAISASSEVWFRERIYKKLNKKLQEAAK